MPTGLYRESEHIMAIEASKFTEKDELIANFYSLRAGLSVIAEETEKIKATENEINKAQNDYDCELRSKESQRTGCLNQISIYEGNMKHNEARVEDEKKKKAGFKSFILGFFATTILLYFTVFERGNLLETSVFFWICSVAGGIVANIIATNVQRYKNTKPYNDRIEHTKGLIHKEVAELARLDVEIEDLKKENGESSNLIAQNLLAITSKFNNEILPQSTAVAQTVRKAMLETSKGILNESDWQNIDFLIFYLETGRADSLKEALQLVDKQRQTEQITRAISEATNHISNTLNAAFNRLGSLMQDCFYNLGQQIQYNHNEAMNTMLNSFASLESTVNAGNCEISNRIGDLDATIKTEGERIVAVETLNSALLNKANDSSDKLMYELRYNQKYWKK